MGILRTDTISGLETPTPVTGSVSFDGSGDYLSVPSTELKFANADFTIECWIYRNTSSDGQIYSDRSTSGVGDWNGLMLGIRSNKVFILASNSGSSWDLNTYATTQGSEVSTLNWRHIALSKSGSTWKVFIDGNLSYTSTLSGSIIQTQSVAWIGEDQYGVVPEFNGYISNLRILKGTALYTSNFTPPTRELQPIGDTVLLCCNNPDSAGAEATGKTITVNGNAVASTFSPGLTRDFTYGTQFDGVSRFDTQGYFVPPSGTTEQRGRGRGVFTISSGTPANSNAINYLQISSSGNSQDFGDLTSISGSAGSVSSSTRMIIALGNNSPVTAGNVNTLDYLTIATTSNTLDFGDLTTIRGEVPGVSNSTRGVFIGGVNELVSPYGGPTIDYTNTMDYVTIVSLGNAIDFGDAHSDAVSHASAVGNTTRGVYTVSWNGSTTVNNINYITFSTTGNGQDFGDLITPQNRQQQGSVSNSTRGLFAGGISPVSVNTIEYITITSLGNAQDFGDLSYARRNAGGTSNSIRGIFAGGYDAPPGPLGRTNVIDYVILASTGNASDFGDLNEKCLNGTGASDSHGGLS
jgi:hypothetical protein